MFKIPLPVLELILIKTQLQTIVYIKNIKKTFSCFQLFCQFKGSGFLLPCKNGALGLGLYPPMLLWYLFLMVSTLESYVRRFWGHVFVWCKAIENMGSFFPSALHKSFTYWAPTVISISLPHFLSVPPPGGFLSHWGKYFLSWAVFPFQTSKSYWTRGSSFVPIEFLKRTKQNKKKTNPSYLFLSLS